MCALHSVSCPLRPTSSLSQTGRRAQLGWLPRSPLCRGHSCRCGDGLLQRRGAVCPLCKTHCLQGKGGSHARTPAGRTDTLARWIARSAQRVESYKQANQLREAYMCAATVAELNPKVRVLTPPHPASPNPPHAPPGPTRSPTPGDMHAHAATNARARAHTAPPGCTIPTTTIELLQGCSVNRLAWRGRHWAR